MAKRWFGGRIVFAEQNLVLRFMLKKILKGGEDVHKGATGGGGGVHRRFGQRRVAQRGLMMFERRSAITPQGEREERVDHPQHARSLRYRDHKRPCHAHVEVEHRLKWAKIAGRSTFVAMFRSTCREMW
jgi:hypothetical protein